MLKIQLCIYVFWNSPKISLDMQLQSFSCTFLLEIINTTVKVFTAIRNTYRRSRTHVDTMVYARRVPIDIIFTSWSRLKIAAIIPAVQ